MVCRIDPVRGFDATLRSTPTATTIRRGDALNALHQEALVLVRGRALPEHDQATIERALVSAVDDGLRFL